MRNEIRRQTAEINLPSRNIQEEYNNINKTKKMDI